MKDDYGSCPWTLQLQTEYLTIVGVLAIAAVLLSALNFRFLMYPIFPGLNPILYARRFTIGGNTLFISDLHLKSDQPFKYAKELRSFIEANRVPNLVINGDLFDSPVDAGRVLGNPSATGGLLEKLGLNGLPLRLSWVLGSPAHDLSTPPNVSSLGGVEILGKCAWIDFGAVQVMAYHGHDLSLKGALGHAWNRFISKLSLERLWKKIAKVDRTLWVFFGHTHIPGIDARNRVANSGGWQAVPFVQPTKTGILITEQAKIPELVKIA